MKKIFFSILVLCMTTTIFAQFTASGVDLYHIGGKVGIGTTSPTLAPLHISANTNLVQIRLERTGTLSGISADIGGHSGNLIFYPGGYSNKNGNVYFNTTGKVGIGTESPEDVLHIFSPGANGSRVTSLLIDGYSQNTLVDGSSQVIRFKGNVERYWGAIGGYTANSKEGMGIFAGNSTSLTTTPGIYLNSDQNAGIGTTSPGTKLEVYEPIGGTSNFITVGAASYESMRVGVDADGARVQSVSTTKPIYFMANGAERMRIEANGNVGIGTTPSAKLEVKGDFIRLQESAATRTLDIYPAVSGQNHRFTSTTTGGGYDFENNVGALMTIAGSGRVGIGTNYTNNGILTVNSSEGTNMLRLENDGNGNEASLRFRAKSSGGLTSHADISLHTTGSEKGYLGFKVPYNNNSNVGFKMIIRDDGHVGIGTTSPQEKLSVDGTVLSKRVRVSEAGADWPDYVFAPSYELRALSEVENHIKENGHLPEVPSAKEIEEKGLDLGAMDATLLKKVEELTLYLIDMKKEIEALKKENKELKSTFAKASVDKKKKK